MRNPSFLVLVAATLVPSLASAAEPEGNGAVKTDTRVAGREGAPMGGGRDAPPVVEVAKDTPTPPPAATPVGLNFDLGWASAYNFRGLNLYGGGKQLDQHGVMTPSARYVFGESGFAIQYISAYPTNGGNQKQLYSAGYAGEQDLVVSYTRQASKAASVTGSMIAYVYPFATRDAAGTAAPVYLEPGVAVTYSTFADLSFSASYFAGVQEVLGPSRYFYLRPSVQKKVVVSTRATLQGDLGVGYKVPTQDAPTDNRVDVAADLKALIPVGSGYLAPGVNYGWSNFDGQSGHMVFASVNAGLDL